MAMTAVQVEAIVTAIGGEENIAAVRISYRGTLISKPAGGSFVVNNSTDILTLNRPNGVEEYFAYTDIVSIHTAPSAAVRYEPFDHIQSVNR